TILTGSSLEETCNAPPTYTVTIASSTIAANQSVSALLAGCPSQVQFLGTIMQRGTMFGCGPASTVVSLGYDALPDDCGPPATTDVTSAIQLEQLGDYGGPTQTMLQISGSPGLNRIPPGTALLCTTGSVDQRHVARPVGPACDIGADEGVGA